MKRNWLSYMCMAALLSGALTSCNESSFLNLSDPNHFTEVISGKIKQMRKALWQLPTLQ